MYFDFSFKIDGNGRSAVTNEENHIRNLIEQTLFTSPGERVNRPTFGCGLMYAVFEPNSDILALSINTMIQSSLNSFLDHLITVESVDVKNKQSVLEVTVSYMIKRNQKTSATTFSREL